jgi:hypothetical protein
MHWGVAGSYEDVPNSYSINKLFKWLFSRVVARGFIPGRDTLQRQNAEKLKQIFPEKGYWGLSPNFHILVSVSELYISTMGLPVLLEEICRLILGIYKSLKDT